MGSTLSEKPGCEVAEPAEARRARGPVSRQQYLDGILHGDSPILTRAITLVESAREADREMAEQIVEDCLPHSGYSIRVGVTGVPGSGKSSLIEAIGQYLTGTRREKVAVLAFDPASILSAGSALGGGKTRMSALEPSDLAFVCPLPSRGLYGAAQRTREAMLLCEAAGYSNILVETVGAGQSETAVRDMVDFFLLVTLAGAGDDLQGIKRGVMELADLVAVNKADGPNTAAAERARGEAENALRYFPDAASGWGPRTVACSALSGKGVRELWDCVLDHHAATRASGWHARVRREQVRRWMHEAIEQGLRQRFESHSGVRSRRPGLEQDVTEGRVTSFAAARELLDLYFAGRS